jgi:hypothetical protein
MAKVRAAIVNAVSAAMVWLFFGAVEFKVLVRKTHPQIPPITQIFSRCFSGHDR